MAEIIGYIPAKKAKKQAKDKSAAPDKDTGKDKKNDDKEASE